MGTATTWIISFFIVITAAMSAVAVVISTSSNRAEANAASEQQLVESLESSFKIIDITQSGGQSLVRVVVTNDGQRSFTNFEDWVVTLKYDQDGSDPETFLVPPFTDTLADNTWTDFEYWLDFVQDDPALIEPGILNPHEEMEIRIQVNPLLESSTYLVVTITSPSGITESATLEV